MYLFYNIIMARFFDPTYDPRQDSGTSGAEVSDLNPEQAYDTDLRRVDLDERRAVEGINRSQDRIGKFLRASKSAGKFRQTQLLQDTQIAGRTPRSEAVVKGVQLPNLGDRVGDAGGTNYARKPGATAGTFYGFRGAS
jgi:hypothetical protein